MCNRAFFQISLAVEPEDPETDLLGKTAAELQENVLVNSDHITGTLKYVTGYTGFSGKAEEQEGNYLALKMTATEGATTTVLLTNGTVNRPVELDSDMNIVLRITNPAIQKVVVTTTKDGYEVSKTYSLSSLRLEAAS